MLQWPLTLEIYNCNIICQLWRHLLHNVTCRCLKWLHMHRFNWADPWCPLDHQSHRKNVDWVGPWPQKLALGHGGQVQGQVRAGPFSSWRRTRTEYRKYILWLTSFKQGMDNICCDCNSSYVLLQRFILFCLLCTYEEITKWVGPFRNYTWWLSLTTQRNWECKGNALVLVFL